VSTATRRGRVELESNRPLGIRRRGPLEGWSLSGGLRGICQPTFVPVPGPDGLSAGSTILSDRRMPCEASALLAPKAPKTGMWVARVLVMTCRRAAGLCLIVAALLGSGCAGRHRLSTVRSVAVHSNGLTSGFAEAGTNGKKDSAAASGKNFPDRKSTDAAQPPQLPPNAAQPQAVGTSGKWVVTAITQRPDGPAAVASTHSVMSEARTSRGPWPMALAGLALVICLVVASRYRRSVPSR